MIMQILFSNMSIIDDCTCIFLIIINIIQWKRWSLNCKSSYIFLYCAKDPNRVANAFTSFSAIQCW